MSVKVTTNIWMTGLGEEQSLRNTYISGITPVGTAVYNTVVNDTVNIAPTGVNMSNAFGLLVHAISGTVYVGMNATAIDCSACHFILSEGAGNFYSINPTLTAVISIIACVSAGSGQIEYAVAAT